MALHEVGILREFIHVIPHLYVPIHLHIKADYVLQLDCQIVFITHGIREDNGWTNDVGGSRNHIRQ